MVYRYPIIDDIHKLGNDGGDIQQNQLSLPFHSKLQQMMITPVKSDKYLMDVCACVDQLMGIATPKVSFRVPPVGIGIRWTISFTTTHCEPSTSSHEEMPMKPEPLPSIISIGDILVKLHFAQLYSNRLTEMLQKNLYLTETIDRWRELKRQLIEFSKFIDKVMQSYKQYDVGIPPEVKKLRKIKNRITKLISRASLEEVNDMFENGVTTSNFDLLTAALGLNGDVASALCEIRKGSCNHQTDQYHIKDIVCNAVEENCSKCDPDTDLADILVASGFSNAKASILAEQLTKDELSSLQPLAYWVEWYLDFMFEYDIFLTTEYKRFPHNEDVLNTWFKIPTTRDSYNESTGEMEEVHFNVQAYNTIDGLKPLTRDGVFYPPRGVEDGVWYHATTHDFAEDIRSDGIRLKSGHLKQDFSNGDGFYLTPYLRSAEEWAAKKGGPNKGAIIIFKHFIDANKYKGMDLCLEESDEKWSQVVKYYRSGQRSRLFKCPGNLAAELMRTEYIEGPMSGDQTKCTHPDWQPTKKNGDSNQLCIKSQKLADEFSRNIDGIIFLSTNSNLQEYGE